MPDKPLSSYNLVKTDRQYLTANEISGLNTYDFMAYLGKRVINPGGLRGQNQILQILNPEPESHVLEIGGGSGHAACYIAERYQCRVTTIDISPRSVREAKDLIVKRGLSNKVNCEIGDVTKLDFDDETFNYVLCQAVIMFTNQNKALSEVRRVLKKKGIFAGLEFSWKKMPPRDVREKTYRICGCQTLDFHSSDGWLQELHKANFMHIKGSAHPFGLLSIRGFLHDEGLTNSMRIVGKVFLRKASITRMSEIWLHFSRNAQYFNYTVFSGRK